MKPSVNAEPNRRPNVTCDRCGAMMYRRPSTLARNAGKFCSRACRNTVHKVFGPNKAKGSPGSRNPSWKGGATYRHRHGNYVQVKYVRCPPKLKDMARADGYVMEHRLVMALRVGRSLTRTECVHHLDHKPLHNAEANLELWPDNRSHKMAEHGKIAEGAANRWCPKG